MASDSTDSDGSDINVKSALPKTTDKKTPCSLSNDLLENKDLKQQTKEMIMQALMDLHSKKGVSLFAVKKYIADRYNVDTEKLKLFIKKSIKLALQEGIIIQTKGIRVSGSFKLATIEEEEPKTKKPKKEKTKKAKRTKDPERKKKLKKKTTKSEEKITEVIETPENPEGESLTSAKESEEDKPVEPKKKKVDTEKKPKAKIPKEKEPQKKKPKEKKPRERKPKEKKAKVKKERVKKVRIPAHLKKPKKITKRRNGVSSSILKPPKMKPQPEI